ncbi:TonB-dependent receptor [Putridiphycobacter roseus]|uniref:TonB-dependent receptor n=1 Tax=Putridiphycobacter roseus TaxID=2219161 RepID=A0A2W1MWS0_9FLAO|nr:TonB-dependent receptor [Putridiphycobacter roseus]PZE16569.1 TonB-dependent receptor [Putridiphycobacter roseus]
MKIILLFGLIICSVQAKAQNVTGKIIDQNKESIPGVIVKWNQKKNYAKTNVEGEFKAEINRFPDTLIVEHIGFATFTKILHQASENLMIELVAADTLSTVVVKGKNDGKSIDLFSARHTELIGQGELRKAACCNLSEAFETNASVDVNLTDAVSGAKKIQMLGLDGVYSQIQFENIPLVRGLSSSYGLGLMPGTWIESIQVTKGTGSVINGYESIAGMINLQLKEPANDEKLYINTYANRFGRAELNIHGVQKLKNWKTMSFLHLSNNFLEVDDNKDGFRDIPVGFSGAFMNRWERRGEYLESKLGIRGVIVNKQGGQIGYQPNSSDNLKYGMDLNTEHLEVFAKNGFFFKNSNTSSLGTVVQAKYHHLQNNFGNKTYEGTQKKLYINTIYSDIIQNTNHNFSTGLSFVLDDYVQSYNDSSFLKTEIVPGAFFEYTYHYLEEFTLVAGLRGDYHNLYGPFFSPRLHAKWNMSKQNALRLSAGRGYRVANPYADYSSLMASSRTWYVANDLAPEDAINAGLTYTQKFIFKERVSTLTLDYFYTTFNNQVVTDLDMASNEIHFYNASGTSYSNSFQAELSIKPHETLELRGAFKYYDVKAEFNGELQQKAFTPKFRALFNVGYHTRNKKWEYDLTGNWMGIKRLPSTASNPVEDQRATTSKQFWLLNSQITYKRPKISFYLGAENILNYTQNNAIISPDDPFGSYFDATQLWAPITGTNIYIGLHYTIKHKKQ